MHAVPKYLEAWAEPEALLAAAIDGSYERTLVVPACREDPRFFEGYVDAAETSSGSTLAILVVNGPDEAGDGVHEENQTLVEGLRAALKRPRELPGPSPSWFGSLVPGKLDALVVDRASEGRRIPRKEGVGLARKLGADLALALRARGRVRSRWIFGTDADATLPPAHFDLHALEDHAGVSAVVFPFWHEAAADEATTRATALYELGLHYHVAGLAWAGSPYAFHTLGSVIAVACDSYAAVRGYPRREAAEDFYLLNKIAKVGGIARPPGAPVRIASRPSDRTPFGTGRAVRELMRGEPCTFPAPAAFEVLRGVLAALTAFAEHADVARVNAEMEELPAAHRPAVRSLLDELGAEAFFVTSVGEAKTKEARLFRMHSWFDAFRSLKLLHAVRDHGAPELPWEEALAAAPFGQAMHPGRDAALAAPRQAYVLAEARGPTFRGPSAPAR